MATISSQHLGLLESNETQSEVEVWLGPARGVLVETTIVGAWLPTTGAGWVDMSADVLLTPGVSVAHDGRGYTISFVVADESRLVWADDLAIAIVSRHFDGGAWTARTLDAWGYLDGSGRSRVGKGLEQTSERMATYAGYWSRMEAPPHRIGRRNLAQGATIAGSTPALASLSAEAGIEYVSQDNNDPEKVLDQDIDKVYVGDIIADPVQPAIGESGEVRILRAYAGRTVRSIGAGDEPIWIELSYVYRVAHWLDMSNPGAVPALHESGSNVRNDGAVTTSFVDSPTYGKMYQIRCKTGQSSPTVMNGVQWNVGLSLPLRPMKLILTYKATSTESIGRRIRVTLKPLDPQATGITTTLALEQTWREAEIDVPDLTNYGGFVLRMQNAPGEVATQDLYFGFRAQAYVGYSDLGAGSKLHLSYDNGAGVTDTLRIAWDLSEGVEDWRIPPLGTIIIADDAKIFRSKFDPGTRQVLQMRNLAPAWFFGPGVGKLALRRGNGFKYLQYAPAGYSLVEEVNFTTNGLTWLPQQGVSRQSPISTGAMAVESVPHVGLFPGDYGGGFVWVDLKAYQPTVLSNAMTSGQTTLTVDDGDRLTVGGEVVIGTERILLGARTENTFVIARAQGGTTAAAHSAGDNVTPRVGGATQTGPQWDIIEIRRKPGTPPLRSGVVIASNLASPGDPSTGGSKWERHPDWFLVTRFDNASGADVISLRSPGGVTQARHVCVGDVLMHRYRGDPQRLKINEIIILEWVPGGGGGGSFGGHSSTNLAEVAGHLLTAHGQVPTAKVAITVSPAPIRDLPIAGATLAAMIGNLESDADMRVWLDPNNFVTIAPDPSNPQYDAREPYLTLDESLLLGEPAGSWSARSPVSQVRGIFTETAALRTHHITYPDIPGLLGAKVEIRGSVRSWLEGRERLVRVYRARNARRTPQERTIGPAPWIRPWLRVVDSLTSLDAGGQWIGVNCVITAFRIRYTEGQTGGAICETTLTLQEVIL